MKKTLRILAVAFSMSLLVLFILYRVDEAEERQGAQHQHSVMPSSKIGTAIEVELTPSPALTPTPAPWTPKNSQSSPQKIPPIDVMSSSKSMVVQKRVK